MQTGSTLMPSATHPRSGSAIFYGGSHYSQTEIPEGFETSCSGLLTCLSEHSKGLWFSTHISSFEG